MTLAEAVLRIQNMLKTGRQHHVVTPNPEMLVAANSHPEFREVLRSSSLNVPDGYGLILASRFLGTPLPERVSGIDLLTELCLHTDQSVFFLGAATGVAEKAAAVLRGKRPTSPRLRGASSALRVAGTYAGSPDPSEEDAIISRINASGAVMLFVAYGAPAQDLWISRNLKRMPTVRVAMGVGGSFDFLAGAKKRAPHFLQTLGLEWTWRLALEPKRIGRIFTAVVIFPLLVLSGSWRRTSF